MTPPSDLASGDDQRHQSEPPARRTLHLLGLPLVAGVAVWLLWILLVEVYVFRRDLATTLLGISLAANAVLVGVLIQQRRDGTS